MKLLLKILYSYHYHPHVYLWNHQITDLNKTVSTCHDVCPLQQHLVSFSLYSCCGCVQQYGKPVHHLTEQHRPANHKPSILSIIWQNNIDLQTTNHLYYLSSDRTTSTCKPQTIYTIYTCLLIIYLYPWFKVNIFVKS